LTIAASHASVVLITAFWLAVGLTLSLWSYFSGKEDLTRDVNRFEEAFLRNEVNELRVRASEMVEFEELEDEGACYAFELSDDRILFISGQEYYPSARFPNTDFSLVGIFDHDGHCVEELIYKRGHKLKPSRIVPAQVKSSLELPGHLDTIQGKLAELEEILSGRMRSH